VWTAISTEYLEPQDQMTMIIAFKLHVFRCMHYIVISDRYIHFPRTIIIKDYSKINKLFLLCIFNQQ
jgi:hypothetical protein